MSAVLGGDKPQIRILGEYWIVEHFKWNKRVILGLDEQRGNANVLEKSR